ncbi:Response regulator [hydrothermal vent metagenome]|uniref:Response regulator n=1 Tax=hydrothermal vent metagenome TaxID=652676 RepID=A0A3B1BEG3_9ZZZZ
MIKQTTAIESDSAKSIATLLLVDDETNILSSLKRLLRPQGYRVFTATGGAEGLKLLAKQPVDLIISDMRMPEMDGAEFLAKAAGQWPDTVRVLLTGYADLSSTVAAVNKGSIYRYVSKPWDDLELITLVQQALKLKRLEDEKIRLEALTQKQNEQLTEFNASLEKRVEARTEELRQTMGFLEQANVALKDQYTTSVKIFANLIELREGIAGESSTGHARRVADQAHRLGMDMGLSEEEAQDLLFAALLHDIGKIALPDALLKRPYDELTANQRKEFEKHPVLGQAALVALEPLNTSAELIRAHHEQFNGHGYPDQLQGKQIPLGARILAVVDDYNALLTGGLSRRSYSPAEAKKFLLEERNERYDGKVVNSFIQILEADSPDTKTASEQCLKSAGLENGMLLTRDLIANNGVLLLSKGHLLNDELITKISQLETAVGYDLLFHVQLPEP